MLSFTLGIRINSLILEFIFTTVCQNLTLQLIWLFLVLTDNRVKYILAVPLYTSNCFLFKYWNVNLWLSFTLEHLVYFPFKIKYFWALLIHLSSDQDFFNPVLQYGNFFSFLMIYYGLASYMNCNIAILFLNFE